jgi:hypothetical protein
MGEPLELADPLTATWPVGTAGWTSAEPPDERVAAAICCCDTRAPHDMSTKLSAATRAPRLDPATRHTVPPLAENEPPPEGLPTI